MPYPRYCWYFPISIACVVSSLTNPHAFILLLIWILKFIFLLSQDYSTEWYFVILTSDICCAGWVCYLHQGAMWSLHGRLPLQPLPDWGSVQGDGGKGFLYSVWIGGWAQGSILPSHWYDQRGSTEAYWWPLPVQGRWQVPPGTVHLYFWDP